MSRPVAATAASMRFPRGPLRQVGGVDEDVDAVRGAQLVRKLLEAVPAAATSTSGCPSAASAARELRADPGRGPGDDDDGIRARLRKAQQPNPAAGAAAATRRQRQGKADATMRSMDDDRTIRIALELDLHGDEVRGRASSDGGAPRDFVGWLGLIAALDALVAPPEPEPADQPASPASARARPAAPQRSASSSASARGPPDSPARPAAVSAPARRRAPWHARAAPSAGEQPGRLAQILDAVGALELAEQPQASADGPGGTGRARELELVARQGERRSRSPSAASARARSVRHGDQTGWVRGGRVRSISIVQARASSKRPSARNSSVWLMRQKRAPSEAPVPASLRSSAARAPAASPRSSRAGRGTRRSSPSRRPSSFPTGSRPRSRARASARPPQDPGPDQREPAPQVGADSVRPERCSRAQLPIFCQAARPSDGSPSASTWAAPAEKTPDRLEQNEAVERVTGERARLRRRADRERALERGERGERQRAGPAAV